MKLLKIFLRILFVLMFFPGMVMYLILILLVTIGSGIEFIVMGESNICADFVFEYIPDKVNKFLDFTRY